MGITVITRVAAGRYRNCRRRSPKPQSLGLLQFQLEFPPVGIFSSLPAICLFSPSLSHGFRVGIATGGFALILLAPCTAIPGKQRRSRAS